MGETEVKRYTLPSLDAFKEQLKRQERNAIAKAITLLESQREDHQSYMDELFQSLAQESYSTRKIGISGPPGSGKSTFIDIFVRLLLDTDMPSSKKVAILTYDPSSPFTGGSLLGDKTRMESLSKFPNVYLRPSPSKNHLGGLGPKGFDTIRLLELIGFDYIFIESVGAGQSEVELGEIVDYFILLLPPNGGDELQGLKKGILEYCDLILVNKAEGEFLEAAQRTAQDYGILHSKMTIRVISALTNQGISELLPLVQGKLQKKVDYSFQLVEKLVLESFFNRLRQKILSDPHQLDVLDLLSKKLLTKGGTIYGAAKRLEQERCNRDV